MDHIRREKIQVLVVDDGSSDTRPLQEACSYSDSYFHYVKTGEEALDYLHQRGTFAGAQRPDLIILDLALPSAKGGEALAQIKGDAELRLLPVIVFSNSSSDEEIRKVYNGHVACVVKRPSEPEQFMEVCQAIGRFWLECVCYPARAD